MRQIFPAVESDALKQSISLFGWLDADAGDLHAGGNISFGFIAEGRHLGPAPGSPPAAVREDHGGRRV